MFIWCSTFSCLYGNPHRRVPAKPRKRIRACARRRKSGLAVLRLGVKPHPCIIGFVGLPTMPQPLATVPGARATARQRRGPRRWPGHRPGARGAAVYAGRACDLAAGRTRSRRWRHRLGTHRPGNRDAGAGNRQAVGAGRHRRAVPVARDARPLFPPHAHAVGIHPAGRARRSDPGLNTAHCDFFSLISYRVSLNPDSCGVAAPV